MIIDLANTKTHAITTRLRELREERGEVATGCVLTFIVVVNATEGHSAHLDRVIESTYDASREHPARVIVLVSHRDVEETRLDAEIRLGGDAGASEIIVMHLNGELSAHRANVVTPLLLPDTPVVVWWPANAPRNPSSDPIGALATRRITDSFFDADSDAIYRRRMTYTPGDSDLVWSRITLWRGLLASTLDQPPHEEILSAQVYGPEGEPSIDIAAGWLADRLDVPVTRHVRDTGSSRDCVSVYKVELQRTDSSIVVEEVNATTVSVTVSRDGEDKQSFVTMSRRATGDCLAEELRHLDPDRAFGHALRGLVRVNRPDRRGMYSKAMRANSEYFDGPAHAGDSAYDQASMR
ncbi:glucose-6-phosphate dehydrogenase assembly protein OpcA [Corynebacterium dentalis]|uniref:glucose-6-phosphate dehydrogenase assembly protein OpcA n=1 Tax=Corynebacterium dentalis TaxID=2014528 RepID=UPI00259813A6|nr:glucose-6-phosphate dehydrogenase assembly protein OpcA [Corynebacterium dentalis]